MPEKAGPKIKEEQSHIFDTSPFQQDRERLCESTQRSQEVETIFTETPAKRSYYYLDLSQKIEDLQKLEPQPEITDFINLLTHLVEKYATYFESLKKEKHTDIISFPAEDDAYKLWYALSKKADELQKPSPNCQLLELLTLLIKRCEESLDAPPLKEETIPTPAGMYLVYAILEIQQHRPNQNLIKDLIEADTDYQESLSVSSLEKLKRLSLLDFSAQALLLKNAALQAPNPNQLAIKLFTKSSQSFEQAYDSPDKKKADNLRSQGHELLMTGRSIHSSLSHTTPITLLSSSMELDSPVIATRLELDEVAEEKNDSSFRKNSNLLLAEDQNDTPAFMTPSSSPRDALESQDENVLFSFVTPPSSPRNMLGTRGENSPPHLIEAYLSQPPSSMELPNNIALEQTSEHLPSPQRQNFRILGSRLFVYLGMSKLLIAGLLLNGFYNDPLHLYPLQQALMHEIEKDALKVKSLYRKKKKRSD